MAGEHPPEDRDGALLRLCMARKAEESTLGVLLIEVVILYSAQSANDNGRTLKDAAEVYKVDVGTISAKVKQEFAARDKAKTTNQARPKPAAKAAKKARAA